MCRIIILGWGLVAYFIMCFMANSDFSEIKTKRLAKVVTLYVKSRQTNVWNNIDKYSLLDVKSVNSLVDKYRIDADTFDKSILTSFDALSKLSGKRLMGDELTLYAELDELNGWKTGIEKPYLSTRQDYVNDFAESCSLFMLGKVVVRKGLESRLLRVKSMFDENNTIYLINTKENSVLSVVKICDWSDWHCCYLIEYEGAYVYMYGKTHVVSEDGRVMDKYDIEMTFKISPDGKIVKLPNLTNLVYDYKCDSLYIDTLSQYETIIMD